MKPEEKTLQLELGHVHSTIWHQEGGGCLTDDEVKELLVAYLRGFWWGKRMWSDIINPDQTPPSHPAEFGKHVGFKDFLLAEHRIKFPTNKQELLEQWFAEAVKNWSSIHAPPAR